MINLVFRKLQEPLRILCLGAHSDDLEIGCGGSVLKLLQDQEAIVYWTVFSCTDKRKEEAVCSAADLLQRAKSHKVVIRTFRDGFFPYRGEEVKVAFEELKSQFSPDLIFTHARNDLHQDHRLVNELTWNTFRDHLILEYEIPKYDADLGAPNVFVELGEDICRSKIDHILKYFQTQLEKRWFDEETFRGLMRLRGVESGTRYAEAFYCRKIII